MRTIGEIRRLRLKALMEEFGLTLAEIGRRIGRDSRDSTLSQVLNASPDSKTGKPRQMGDAQARKLEEAFDKQTGWMDHDPVYDAILLDPNGQVMLIEVKGGQAAQAPLPHVLEQLGSYLLRLPLERRDAVARNLHGWAIEGGPPHYVSALVALMDSSAAGSPQDKPQATGT